MTDKWSEIFDRITPLFLILLAGGWISLSQMYNWSDLKSYAIGVGGAGLGLLTQQAKNRLMSHVDVNKGGALNVTPPSDPNPPAS